MWRRRYEGVLPSFMESRCARSPKSSRCRASQRHRYQSCYNRRRAPRSTRDELMEIQSSNQEVTVADYESLQVVEPFSDVLSRHGLELTRSQTVTLQVNCGLLCNQSCKHCHLEAGPRRREVMDRKTID